MVGIYAYEAKLSPFSILAWSCTLTKIYPTTVLILFSILTLQISHQLKNINENIVQLISAGSRYHIDNRNLSNSLKILQQKHLMIHHSIELLNKSFGPFLLFQSPCIFISVINAIVFILIIEKTIYWYSLLYTTAIVGSYTLSLVLICLSTDRIEIQVG